MDLDVTRVLIFLGKGNTPGVFIFSTFKGNFMNLCRKSSEVYITGLIWERTFHLEIFGLSSQQMFNWILGPFTATQFIKIKSIILTVNPNLLPEVMTVLLQV